MTYKFERAGKDLFAAYQVIHSQADVEMWYNWEAQLDDTRWTDDCYFLYADGEKIGGAIVTSGLTVLYPFLVQPFCDRELFWKHTLRFAAEVEEGEEILLRGVLAHDIDLLQRFGARIWEQRQMMCRPTEKLAYELDDEFEISVVRECDIDELGEAYRESYIGGICYELGGVQSVDKCRANMREEFERYTDSNSLELFVVAKEKASGKIVGSCVAGLNPKMPNGFAGISDFFVLPQYRRMGIAQGLLRHSITAAHVHTPVIKLHVFVGNTAERLYRKNGFVSGAKFTHMKLKRELALKL